MKVVQRLKPMTSIKNGIEVNFQDLMITSISIYGDGKSIIIHYFKKRHHLLT